MAYDYDLIVIGSGPAGEKGAVKAAYFGKHVAVIEKEPQPGGAAVHTGTLPSKTLRETSLYLSGRSQRKLYGVNVTLDRAIAVPRLLSRKDAVRALEVDRIYTNIMRNGVDLIRGTGRLVDPHTVEVTAKAETRRLSAQFLLIATGSVPYQPSDIPFEDPAVDDSDSILELDHMPDSMAVIGGGVIGCEYTCMFAALDVKVTLIEPRTELLSFLDAEMSEALRVALIGLGVDVRLGERANQVRRQGDKILTTLSCGETLAVDKLLFAGGRAGNTAGLNLEGVGVQIGKRGSIVVDDHYRTSVPSIYAAGDVIGFPALASVSMEQARAAVAIAFGLPDRQEVSDLLPYGIYTIPEVSCVGLSDEDATARGISTVVGRAYYRENARGKIIGDNDGMVKLVFERPTRKLLGAHCIGDRATELVHIGQSIIALGGTVETLVEMVFNYPTLAECYKYAAYDALRRFSDGP